MIHDTAPPVTGTIFDIKRYAVHDGPGIRTTVFLKGCPLSCTWCHNPEGIDAAPQFTHRPDRCIRCGTCIRQCRHQALARENGILNRDPDRCVACGGCVECCPAEALERVGRTVTPAQVAAEVEKEIPFFDQSGGGVTFSGGEPLAQPRFLLALLAACGDLGIHRAVDTTGHAPEATLLQVAASAELILYDLKQVDPEIHRRHTGVSNTLILENLIRLARTDTPFIVRIPAIPGVNADVESMTRAAAFISKLPRVPSVHILPFHPSARAKYERLGRVFTLFDGGEIPSPPVDRLIDIMAAHGIHADIGG